MTRSVLFWLFAIVLVLFGACREDDDFITDPGAKLEFSLDTLRFDTVFTQRGSATRFFKVYNRNNRPIRISSVEMGDGRGAFFRINVDGLPGNLQEEVRIEPNDSIYVFAEVTVDPDQPVSVSPFVITDSITFVTNGNTQRVLVEAWGQNANYFPERFATGVAWSPCFAPEVTWDDPKPYVIYGLLVIDECTLRIPAGTRIYVHGGIARNPDLGVFNDGLIFVSRNGRIITDGTADEPVIIQGDRLEEEFQNRSGQWAGIIIDDLSRGSRLNFTTVKNSSLGIAVDSAAELTLKNVQIYNTNASGLVGIQARIIAENCLFHSNGGNCVQLVYGGTYSFAHCTLASFGVDAASLSMANGICLDAPFCTEVVGFPLNATFRNTILFGSRSDEITMTDFGPFTGAAFNYRFDHCIVRVRDLTDPERGGFPDFFNNCIGCINASPQDTLFANISEDDYRLDTLSIAEGRGLPLPSVNFDLEGNPRDPQDPDIGCYEYQY